MKQSAPCYVLPWTTAPCQGMTAPMASNKTKMDACSASVSTVSSLSSLYVQAKGLKFQGLTCRSMSVIHFFWHAASCSIALKWWTCYLFAHADVQQIWQPLGSDSNRDMFVVMTAYLRPWLQPSQGSLSQECSYEQPRSNSCLCLWWIVVPMIGWPLPQFFSDDSCPDLGKYCSLQCPMGYERDDFGCEVCQCSIPVPKCRPLTCTKTCPYGYV